MLTDQLRPSIWSEMAGQVENIKILKAIIKNPEKAPKTLILEGAWGTGKTTSVRILAKELNGIKDPNYNLDTSPFYYEYDSTVIGNVEEIKKLRETFGIGYEDYWKIIVLDEVHAVSQQAQTALLKVLEEVSYKTFFCLCTTHAHKLIPTIRSRALELRFGKISYEEIIAHLNDLDVRLQINTPIEIKDLIATRSEGHMRDIHMLLDRYLLVGEDGFKGTIESSINLYCDYFVAVRSDNVEDVLKNINKLLHIPLSLLENDFNMFIIKVMKCIEKMPVNSIRIEEIVHLYGTDITKLIKCFFGSWMRMAFEDEYHFQASMLYFYTLLKRDIQGIRADKIVNTGASIGAFKTRK